MRATTAGNPAATSCPEFLDPRQHLPTEQTEIGDRFLVAEQAALTHHQEVPEAADMVEEGTELVKNVVRCAGEAEAGIDRVGYRDPPRIDGAAVARLDAAGAKAAGTHPQGLCALCRRGVAGRVHKLGRDDARSAAVVEDLVGSPFAFLAGIADPDQRH